MYRLLCLLILALAPVAVADSIDYQGAGSLKNGTASVMGSIAAGHVWSVTDVLLQIDDLTTGRDLTGKFGTITVATGTLFKCASGLCFTGGTLDVDGAHNNSLFDATFLKGSISIAHGTTILAAHLANGAATVIRDNTNSFSTQALVHTPGVVPEPMSLVLMATGLLGTSLAYWKKRGV